MIHRARKLLVALAILWNAARPSYATEETRYLRKLQQGRDEADIAATIIAINSGADRSQAVPLSAKTVSSASNKVSINASPNIAGSSRPYRGGYGGVTMMASTNSSPSSSTASSVSGATIRDPNAIKSTGAAVTSVVITNNNYLNRDPSTANANSNLGPSTPSNTNTGASSGGSTTSLVTTINSSTINRPTTSLNTNTATSSGGSVTSIVAVVNGSTNSGSVQTNVNNNSPPSNNFVSASNNVKGKKGKKSGDLGRKKGGKRQRGRRLMEASAFSTGSKDMITSEEKDRH